MLPSLMCYGAAAATSWSVAEVHGQVRGRDECGSFVWQERHLCLFGGRGKLPVERLAGLTRAPERAHSATALPPTHAKALCSSEHRAPALEHRPPRRAGAYALHAAVSGPRAREHAC